MLFFTLLSEQFYVSFLARFCTETQIVHLHTSSQSLNLRFSSFCYKIVIFDDFTLFFLEYKSAKVEESKTGFGFLIAQKRREIQPPTSESPGGSGGRVFRDRDLIFCNAHHFHILATILDLCVITIGGRLHAANRVSKFVLFKIGGRFLSSRST